eukprot:1186982-Prorocentrum_minimum.AAC.2
MHTVNFLSDRNRLRLVLDEPDALMRFGERLFLPLQRSPLSVVKPIELAGGRIPRLQTRAQAYDLSVSDFLRRIG